MHDLRHDVPLSSLLSLSPSPKEKQIPNINARYNPNNPKLLEARHHCRGVTADYNSFNTKTVSYDQIFAKRLEMLRRVVGKVGDGTFVEPPFLPDYGCNVIIGRNCFFNWKFVSIPPFPFFLCRYAGCAFHMYVWLTTAA